MDETYDRFSQRPDGKTQVLFLVGAQRTGSTLLANALGMLPDSWNDGESALAWLSRAQGRPCAYLHSCAECEVWARVFNVALGEVGSHRGTYDRMD